MCGNCVCILVRLAVLASLIPACLFACLPVHMHVTACQITYVHVHNCRATSWAVTQCSVKQRNLLICMVM